MTSFLLDTSAYAAFKRNHPGMLDMIQTADEIHLTPVVLAELIFGFRRGRHRSQNERELQEFLSSPRVVLQPITEETSDRYAVILDSLLHKGTPIPTHDIWIAASAMQHGLVVLTTDKHFAHVPQILVRCLDVG